MAARLYIHFELAYHNFSLQIAFGCRLKQRRAGCPNGPLQDFHVAQKPMWLARFSIIAWPMSASAPPHCFNLPKPPLTRQMGGRSNNELRTLSGTSVNSVYAYGCLPI